jgi:hypothetical protein
VKGASVERIFSTRDSVNFAIILPKRHLFEYKGNHLPFQLLLGINPVIYRKKDKRLAFQGNNE